MASTGQHLRQRSPKSRGFSFPCSLPMRPPTPKNRGFFASLGPAAGTCDNIHPRILDSKPPLALWRPVATPKNRRFLAFLGPAASQEFLVSLGSFPPARYQYIRRPGPYQLVDRNIFPEMNSTKNVLVLSATATTKNVERTEHNQVALINAMLTLVAGDGAARRKSPSLFMRNCHVISRHA